MALPGISLPDSEDIWPAHFDMDYARVALPRHLAALLSWVSSEGAPIACAALLVRPGRVVVQPKADARRSPIVTQFLEGHPSAKDDAPGALYPQEDAEVARRLRVTPATITGPDPAFRLRLARAILPMLHLSRDERRVYLFESHDRIEVASLRFAEREAEKWPDISYDLEEAS